MQDVRESEVKIEYRMPKLEGVVCTSDRQTSGPDHELPEVTKCGIHQRRIQESSSQPPWVLASSRVLELRRYPEGFAPSPKAVAFNITAADRKVKNKYEKREVYGS